MTIDWTNPWQTLDMLKNESLCAVSKEEKWYTSFRKWHSFFSRTVRVVSLILFSYGIIHPMLPNHLGGKDLNLGYISLAIGSFILLLDKYLGISSGYTRFYVAELDIKQSTSAFIDDWNIEIAKSQPNISIEQIVVLLEHIKTYRANIFKTIQVETGAWANEFQAQTGELYEMFKKKQEEKISALGSISATIENYAGYINIKLTVDDTLTTLLSSGSTSAIFRNLDSGLHKITIEASKAGVLTSFSKNISVPAGKVADLSMRLP